MHEVLWFVPSREEILGDVLLVLGLNHKELIVTVQDGAQVSQIEGVLRDQVFHILDDDRPQVRVRRPTLTQDLHQDEQVLFLKSWLILG